MSLLLTLLLFTQTPSAEDTQYLKTFYLSGDTTLQRLTEISTALRQRIAIRAAVSSGVNAVTVRDTATRIDQAERILPNSVHPGLVRPFRLGLRVGKMKLKLLKRFILSDAATQQDLTEILTALRTL